MAIAFEDPYGGGTPDLTLGQSRITPRETYSADPGAIRAKYSERMSHANQLVEALAGLAGAFDKLGKEQAAKEVDQADINAANIAGQVSEAIARGESADLKIGALNPSASPLAIHAQAQILGKDAGFVAAQKAFEEMPADVKNDPIKVQQYFNSQIAAAGQTYRGSPLYGNAYVKSMRHAFSSYSQSMSAQRDQVIRETQKADSQERFERIMNDDLPTSPNDTPAGSRPLHAPIAEPGEKLVVPGTSHQIESNVTPEGAALLRTITRSEAGSAGNPYTLHVGGGHFSSFDDHPRKFTANFGRGPSSASGAYQFTKTTWDEYAKKYEAMFVLKNGKVPFTPENQDRMAWYLAQDRYARITGRSLQNDLKSPEQHGRILNALSNEWTSLPGGMEPNKATGGQASTLARELAAARGSQPKNVTVASNDKAPVQTDVAAVNPTAPASPAGTTPAPADPANPTPAAPAPEQPQVKQPLDYAGRPESLPPEVLIKRQQLMQDDKIQDYTNPTVENAKKRDHMVEAVLRHAIRQNDAKWLKAVPNQILTPDHREMMRKAEKQIETETWERHRRAVTMANERRTEGSRQWQIEANDYLSKNPNAELPAEMLKRAHQIGNPDLVDDWNKRRAAMNESTYNPREEAEKADAIQSYMLKLAAEGKDPREVPLREIVDLKQHQKLLTFAQELRKNGGEFSNPDYDRQWTRAASSLWGFQYGQSLPGREQGNPLAVETEFYFKKQLIAKIAEFTKDGKEPGDQDRLTIFQNALEATKAKYPPTNVVGPDGPNSQTPKTPADLEIEKAVKRLYGRP